MVTKSKSGTKTMINDSSDNSKENASTVKKPKRWKVFFTIVILAFIIIIYVANVIYINGLMKENQELSEELEKLKNKNVILIKEINNLHSAERITNIAQSKLGMIRSEKPPKIIE